MNGKQGLDLFKDNTYDICIFDVMLPEMDGFALAKLIRTVDTEIPIIFLTAKSQKENKIEGLTLGADDYITKPFSIEELLLRIKVFLKRNKITNKEESDLLSVGSFRFDYANLKLMSDETAKNLTQKEGDLLSLLISNKNNIIKRSAILEKLWGQDDYFLGRSMDVFISRLRKYLKADSSIKLENIHGVGFRLNCQDK